MWALPAWISILMPALSLQSLLPLVATLISLSSAPYLFLFPSFHLPWLLSLAISLEPWNGSPSPYPMPGVSPLP